MHYIQPDAPEPLRNIDLESSVYGLRMGLTPEETAEARAKFLQIFFDSTLVAPSLQVPAVGPDGAVLPNVQISLAVVTTPDDVDGIPAFLTVGALRAMIGHEAHGILLTGGELCAVVAASDMPVFILGEGIEARVETEELRALANRFIQSIGAERQDLQAHMPLRRALIALRAEDTQQTREQVAAAYAQGFIRLPVADDEDKGKPVITLSHVPEPDQAPGSVPEISLLVEDNHLLVFTSPDTMLFWSNRPRPAIVLHADQVAALVIESKITGLRIDSGSEHAHDMRFEQEKAIVAE